MTSITSANATFMLGITDIYDTAVEISQWASDDAFATESLEIVQTQMGVDGNLSGGFVYNPVRQTLTLQANSSSAVIFDTWASYMLQDADVYTAFATIEMPALDKTWTLSNGFLTNYIPVPEAKKILQPRTFVIEWESAIPS